MHTLLKVVSHYDLSVSHVSDAFPKQSLDRGVGVWDFLTLQSPYNVLYAGADVPTRGYAERMHLWREG